MNQYITLISEIMKSKQFMYNDNHISYDKVLELLKAGVNPENIKTRPELPVCGVLPSGTKYYIRDKALSKGYRSKIWNYNEYDFKLLSARKIYLSPEGALNGD